MKARFPCLILILAWPVTPSLGQEVSLPGPCDAGCCEPPPPKVLWMEKQYPVTTLVGREVITKKKHPTLEVAYREEKRTLIDMVIKQREVEKVVPCPILVPCTEIDPHTGCPVTIYKTVMTHKVVKDTVFETVPEKKVVTVKVPYLKHSEEIIPHKTIIFEARTHLQKKECPVVIPAAPPGKTQVLIAPEPPCCPLNHPH
jgi:hypothetical protein